MKSFWEIKVLYLFIYLFLFAANFFESKFAKVTLLLETFQCSSRSRSSPITSDSFQLSSFLNYISRQSFTLRNFHNYTLRATLLRKFFSLIEWATINNDRELMYAALNNGRSSNLLNRRRPTLSPKIHIAYYKIPVYADAICHNVRKISRVFRPIRKLSRVMSKISPPPMDRGVT